MSHIRLASIRASTVATHLYVLDRAVLCALFLRTIALRRVSIRRDLEQRLSPRVRHIQTRERDCDKQSAYMPNPWHALLWYVSQRVWSLTKRGEPSVLLTFPIPARSAAGSLPLFLQRRANSSWCAVDAACFSFARRP